MQTHSPLSSNYEACSVSAKKSFYGEGGRRQRTQGPGTGAASALGAGDGIAMTIVVKAARMRRWKRILKGRSVIGVEPVWREL